MKLVNTLPFRPEISNILSNKRLKKSLIFFAFSCFALLYSGCSRLNEVKTIDIEIWLNGSSLNCKVFENNQQVWSIQQLAFFISDINLSSENNVQQAQLEVTPWQANNVVLIQPHLPDCTTKLEVDDQSEQKDLAILDTLKTNNLLQFSVPVDLDASNQLSFSLAVPFALNHENPLLQPSPLNLPSMFWSWRSGHKFLRLDMQGATKNWVFHLGSVGCTAVSTMRAPKEQCVQPNRVNFTLDKKHDGTKLVMHLDRLIANTSLQDSDSCLFHSGQESCSILMSNLKTKDVFEWH